MPHAYAFADGRTICFYRESARECISRIWTIEAVVPKYLDLFRGLVGE